MIFRDCCEELANMADTLIRDVNDPIILQPASLDIATVKRKTDDENFGIVFDIFVSIDSPTMDLSKLIFKNGE